MSMQAGAKEFRPSWMKNGAKTTSPENNTAQANNTPNPAPKPGGKNEGFNASNDTPNPNLPSGSKWARPLQQKDNGAKAEEGAPQQQQQQQPSAAERLATRSPPTLTRGQKPPLPQPRTPTPESAGQRQRKEEAVKGGKAANAADNNNDDEDATQDTHSKRKSDAAAAAALLSSHTKAEAEEISRKSTMNAEAKQFVPKFLQKKSAAATSAVARPQVPASPPPRPPVSANHLQPPTTPPAQQADAALQLNDTWHLYYIDRRASAAQGGNDSYDPYLIYTIDNLPMFWRVVNNVPSATRANPQSTFFLFRNGILPKWEDEANALGGAETMKFPSMSTPDTIDTIWERLCCASVGEAWTEETRSKVNGVTLKVRDRFFVMQVWVRERVNDMPSQLRRMFDDVTGGYQLTEYIPHQQVRQHAQTIASEVEKLPPKPKPKRKK